MKINKTILFALLLTVISSCVESSSPPVKPTINKIIVKKKYSENTVTKDLLFDTGNWHSISYYIVDSNNKIYNVRRDVFIICDEKDTLYEDKHGILYLSKNEIKN